jgi:hypothetical protein
VNYNCNPILDLDCIDRKLDIEYLYNNSETIVNCINIYFNIGFQINRESLYENLLNLDYICKYSPEIYSGINLSIKIPVNFNEIIENKDKFEISNIGRCKCTQKCTCSNVSFLIFQSGNIIGSGFKNYEQINYISKIFIDLCKRLQPVIEKKNQITNN